MSADDLEPTSTNLDRLFLETNNVLENWQRGFAELLSCYHPTIYEFIESPMTEHAKERSACTLDSRSWVSNSFLLERNIVTVLDPLRVMWISPDRLTHYIICVSGLMISISSKVKARVQIFMNQAYYIPF
jgi:hypothetical protein